MSEITLLDGGLGREISRRNLPFKQPEWSALILTEQPEALVDIHLDFIKAGAQVITTNTYAVAPFHIGEERFLNEHQALCKVALDMAFKAKQLANREVKVAFSIPPLFGSYRADLFDETKAKEYYPMLIEQSKTADLLLCETLSSIKEAKLLLTLLQDIDKPYWLSFTLSDEHKGYLRSLEPIDSISEMLQATNNKPEAVLFNCSQPEVISEGIKQIQGKLPEPIKTGGYANSFEKVRALHQANRTLSLLREDLEEEAYVKFVKQWIADGATVVGGCCGIGPSYIQKIKEELL